MLAQIFIGLGIALAQWAYAILLGLFLLEACGEKTFREATSDAVDLLVWTATGFAVEILVLFCLAQVHQLFAFDIAIALMLTLAAAVLLSLRKTTTARSSAKFRSAIKSTLNPAWLITFGICAFLSAPAILPPIQYDSTMYHLAYAVEWSRAGALTVDRFLHFPLSEFNIELLDAMMFAFHLQDYVQFITWCFFCVTATGAVALTDFLLVRAGSARLVASAISLMVAAVFISCPIVLALMDTSYVDLPAGALMLAFGAAAIRARDDFSRAGLALAIIGGSFIGTKISFFPTLVLLVVILCRVGVASKVSRRTLVCTFAVLLVFASPWYLRNLLIAGDPIDPVLNIALHHPDPFWSSADLQRQKDDLTRPISIFAIPAFFYFYPYESGAGVSSSFLFFYVALFLAFVLCINKRLRNAEPELSLICGVVVFAMLQQFLESNRYNRYSMPFFALFIVLMAFTSWLSFRWFSKALLGRFSQQFEWLSVASMLLMMIPPPAPFNEYHDLSYQFQSLSTAYRYPQYYRDTIAGYQAATDLARLVALAGTGERVLDVNFQNLHFVFRRKGVVSVGDWWGPGRYADLQTAINEHKVAEYLKRLSIGAIMFGRDMEIFGDTLPTFVFEIQKAGFREISDPEGDSRTFVRPELLIAAKAHGYVVSQSAITRDRLYLESAFDDATVFDSSGAVKSKVVGGSAFVFSVLDDRRAINALTVTAGNEVRFTVKMRAKHSRLTFKIAKVLPVGSAAIGWVDLDDGHTRRRVFSVRVPASDRTDPLWRNVSISLNGYTRPITLVFGAQSVRGGGNGDWVAFAHPVLTQAEIVRSKSVAAATPSPLPDALKPSQSNAAGKDSGSIVRLKTDDVRPGVVFSAEPNPASISPSNGGAIVTVKWNVPGARQIDVHISAPNGQLFTSGGSFGSATTAAWVGHGTTFYLQDVSQGAPGITDAILTAQ